MEANKEKRKKIWQIIAYGAAILIIAGLSVALALVAQRHKRYRNEMENMYEKSYYDAMSSIAGIEINLTKLAVSNDVPMQKVLLTNLNRDSEAAETNLSMLNSKDQPIENIMKFFNQLGDYCKMLSDKIGEDVDISEEEHQKLQQFVQLTARIRKELQSVQNELLKGGSLMGKFNGDLNYLTDVYKTLNTNDDIEFPQMIYDGPFSDGLSEREPKALKGMKELSAQECAEKIKGFFKGKDVTVKKTGESEEGNIPNYMFDITVDGIQGSMQLSKKGGMPMMYDSYKAIDYPELDEEQCVAKAGQFLKDVGYDNMKAVWTSNYNSTLYINFAFVKNNVIYFPDLIKVKIACDSGDVVGFEAQNYLYNHTEDGGRTSILPNMDEVEYDLHPDLELIDKRFVIIPTVTHKEKAAVEYHCKKGDTEYYIYVDAQTNEEEEIFIVVDDNGKMMI